MRNEERGASQIPLVICIVLLLVAGFFAYTQYSERESMENRLNSILDAAKTAAGTPPQDGDVKQLIAFAKGAAREYKQRLEEILVATGGGDTDNLELVVSAKKLQATGQKLLDALDRGAYLIEFPVDRYIDDPNGGVKIQEAAGKVTTSYVGSKELRGKDPDLTAIIEYVVQPAMNRMVNDIKRYRDAYINAVAAKETSEAGYRKDLAAKDAEIKAQMEAQSALERSKNDSIAELRRQLADAEAAKAASENEKNTAVTAITAERNALKSELEKMTGTVKVLKDKKRAIELDTSPDGSVLSVGDRQDFAVIDLGRATNNLQPGTNFEVYAIGKGGMEIHKGTLKVTKTDANSSECRIIDVLDAFNPVSPGDKIRSVFYSPKETIHVALVGRFTKMGKSDMARRLQTLGVVVDEKVNSGTTYLVVGNPESESQPIEETAEYKTADLYGIPHLSERELSKFTMY
jgi:hypothetical protein